MGREYEKQKGAQLQKPPLWESGLGAAKLFWKVLLLNISCCMEEELSHPLSDTAVGKSFVVCKVDFKM